MNMVITHHLLNKEKVVTALVYTSVPASWGSKHNSFDKGPLGLLLSTIHNRPKTGLALELTPSCCQKLDFLLFLDAWKKSLL